VRRAVARVDDLRERRAHAAAVVHEEERRAAAQLQQAHGEVRRAGAGGVLVQLQQRLQRRGVHRRVEQHSACDEGRTARGGTEP
jgi:hypothetical protein